MARRISRQRGQKGLTHEGVIHGSNQVVLRLHVVVEAHRPHAKFLRDATHGYGLEALLVGEGERDSRYLLAAEPRFES